MNVFTAKELEAAGLLALARLGLATMIAAARRHSR